MTNLFGPKINYHQCFLAEIIITSVFWRKNKSTHQKKKAYLSPLVARSEVDHLETETSRRMRCSAQQNNNNKERAKPLKIMVARWGQRQSMRATNNNAPHSMTRKQVITKSHRRRDDVEGGKVQSLSSLLPTSYRSKVAEKRQELVPHTTTTRHDKGNANRKSHFHRIRAISAGLLDRNAPPPPRAFRARTTLRMAAPRLFASIVRKKSSKRRLR